MTKARAVRVWCRLACLAIILGALVAAMSMEWREEVDVRSGRMRSRWLIAGCTLSESITDTDFSRMATEFVDPRLLPDWRTVHSFSLLQPRSPFYTFHSVPYALQEFVFVCRLGWLNEEDQARIVPEILASLEDEDIDNLEEILSKVRTGRECNGLPTANKRE